MQKYITALALLAIPISLTQLFGKEDWKAEDYFENSSSQKNAAADLMQYVEIKDSDTILDVGCGDGKITAEIAAKDPNGIVTGVDISSAMIDFAKANFPHSRHSNLSFDLKDAQKLDFNAQFDTIFSFTALQWVQDHDAFIQGARKGLKAGGTLAVTMPMGLPAAMEQAVSEVIATPKWSSYFQNFSTGWNFIEKEEYGALLAKNQFVPSRLVVAPQKDVFPSREVFEKFIGQWFPYLEPLPQELKQPFLSQVLDRFFELDPKGANGEVYFKVRRLEVVAKKEPLDP